MTLSTVDTFIHLLTEHKNSAKEMGQSQSETST